MSDDPDSPGSGDEEIWSEVDEAFADGSAAVRRDGFTPKRRRVLQPLAYGPILGMEREAHRAAAMPPPEFMVWV